MIMRTTNWIIMARSDSTMTLFLNVTNANLVKNQSIGRRDTTDKRLPWKHEHGDQRKTVDAHFPCPGL